MVKEYEVTVEFTKHTVNNTKITVRPLHSSKELYYPRLTGYYNIKEAVTAARGHFENDGFTVGSFDLERTDTGYVAKAMATA